MEDYRNSESHECLGTPFSPYTELDSDKITEKFLAIIHPHTASMPKNIVYDRLEEGEDIHVVNEKKYAKYR